MAAQPPPEKPRSKPDEFDRFEHLAKRLVKVPKRELDEARKRDEAERAASRGE